MLIKFAITKDSNNNLKNTNTINQLQRKLPAEMIYHKPHNENEAD